MKHLFTFCLVLNALSGFARKQDVYFIRGASQEVSTKDSADFIRIVSEPDSGSTLFNLNEYYINGRPKFVGKSAIAYPAIPNGPGISFYPNGRRKLIANYSGDRFSGDYVRYFDNGKTYLQKHFNDIWSPNYNKVECLITYCGDSTGKASVLNGNGYLKEYDDRLKDVVDEGRVVDGKKEGEWKGADGVYRITYIEQYENGVLKSGVSTDEKGIKYTYTERVEPAKFPGGIELFYGYLQMAIRYPAASRDNNIQGKVFIQYYTETDGSISNLIAVRTPDIYLGREALRVMAASPAWIPGKQYGKIARQQYTIPIVFALRSY